MKMIFTHLEAANIIEMFEDILARYDIVVPSPEDDERDPDNMVGLYGSVYSELLDAIEDKLIALLEDRNDGAKIVTDTFNDFSDIDLEKDKMWEAWAESQDVRQEMIERGEVFDE